MLLTILRHFHHLITTLPTSALPIAAKKKNQCQRDEVLEKKARELIQAYSPMLAECVRVSWNSRLRTTAGLALYHSWEIFLHPGLQSISDKEVDRTLKHELAHLLARARSGKKRIAPHGKEWRQACADLGIPKEKSTHQLPFARTQQKRKVFYHCPSCHKTLSRVRPSRREIACLSCCRKYNNGRYDQQFRYQLLDLSVR